MTQEMRETRSLKRKERWRMDDSGEMMVLEI